ncbi:AAA domain-containing protein [Thermothelomyces heterothallicus CBS 202.75]|uniref:AAA domain-containing protein n=1 Tax=Thermothelomyces heterothallicus CBS 202.75 TaxID=1149848 RepID=UPI0037447693
MDGPPPNIYIIGAQCTGKTTLVNHLRAHFANRNPVPDGGPPALISEVARTVLKAHHFTARDVRIPSRSLVLQRLILQAQAAAERDALESGGPRKRWFISDRSGADPIAYSLRYVGHEAARALAKTEEWVELKERMRQSVVIICEAGKGVAGWLKDDGVRLMPVDLEEWVGFHRGFCEFLDGEGVRYEVLTADVATHEERVDFVLKRWEECWRKRTRP